MYKLLQQKEKLPLNLSYLLLRKIKSPYLILIPCLYILHASEGRIRESKGTVLVKRKVKNNHLRF